MKNKQEKNKQGRMEIKNKIKKYYNFRVERLENHFETTQLIN